MFPSHFVSDLNECANKNGGCTHTCANTLGGYYCTCAQGFQLAQDQKTCIRKRGTEVQRFLLSRQYEWYSFIISDVVNLHRPTK